MGARRNLLILLTSGLRSDAVSDERIWPLPTPHLERLSGRGVRLVLTSACPIDCGGMVSLLTGLHARQHGYVTPTSIQDVPINNGLPVWLAEAGYHLAGVGSVGQFGSMLARRVITEDVSLLDPKSCDYWRVMRSAGITPAIIHQRRQRLRFGSFEPERLMLDPDEDIDGFIAAEAIKLIAELPTDKPWALFVIFSGPGNDLPPPTLYDAVVEPAQLAGGFAPADLSELNALAEPAYPRVMLQRLEPYSIGRVRSDYLGRVSLIDHGVGRIMDATNNRPDRDRTWTVFASDRGHLLGEHGLVGHRSFLAGAVEVPLMIVPPLFGPKPKQADDDGLYSTVDVAPTIAALGGCDLPPATAGRPLTPIFNGEPVLPAVPGSNLSEFSDRVMLETERYKVVFERCHRTCIGLYDLVSDPDERQNLVESDTGRSVVDSLRWRLADVLLPLRAVAV